MSKILFAGIITLPILFGYQAADSDKKNYSTTSVVTIVGGTILAQHTEAVEKYKRKDCPVCEGKGWYMSGDGIKKIECQYCEE